MDTVSALAAIRFGSGLSPRHAPPAGPEAILAALSEPDLPRENLSEVTWDKAAADAIDWMRKRRVRLESDATGDAFRSHNQAMIGRWYRDLARVVHRLALRPDGLRERLALFWADHFTVAGHRGFLRRAIPSYEADLRAGMTGSFADLLILAVSHPAMIEYLDQRRSIGPNSPRGRRRGGGLNENLAREVLELHTLGAGGPYTQQDVTQLAELMTGLTLTQEGEMRFNPNFAEPGAETVLGASYGGREATPDDLRAALDDLSIHPATAHHISRKLAVHFVSDDPEPALVAAMARAWEVTGGDLMAVYRAMLTHDAAWDPTLRKVRRPVEMVGAALRALDFQFNPVKLRRVDIRDLAFTPMRMMGQHWHVTDGPDGWPEAAEQWINPQLLAARINWAMSAPLALGQLPDPRAFVDTALGPLASGRTRFAAQAAESREVGIGLILSSPEFQRR